MIEEEVGELYIHLASQYESSINALIAKGLIDTDFAIAQYSHFYALTYGVGSI